MKRILIFAILGMIISCSRTEEKDLMVVNGDIEGLKKGTIYLQQIQDGKLVNLDSVKADGNGKFTFKRKLTSPEVFYIYLDLSKKAGTDLGDRLLFFGEPKTITINSAYDMFEVKAKISGSEAQQQYDEYLKTIRRFSFRNAELLEKQVNALRANNIAEADSLGKISERNQLHRHLFVLNYALHHPDSYISPYVVLSDAADTGVKYLDSIYNGLSKDVASSKYGKEMKLYIEEMRKVSQ